ncbi:tetratricopeptide repeat protein [Calycomorphotria hydatis]|uniref:Tetratricopeptide repeat protein n=1 Tax=Calycomorphotria hydatis TaxID=2528027 RepID=A0A517TAY0_9PLAN|nr:hypothetical protein [Calycomorphotria hydatis]QDT65528.1 hypothetical protein V22_27830 [Calycomorphotria hydatis]
MYRREQALAGSTDPFERILLKTFLILAVLLLSMWSVVAFAEELPTNDEQTARRSAVALNYCRSSFYRIRNAPTNQVMLEEQEKILNNLDLSGIADEEVIKLYGSVLDEINDTSLAQTEEKVVRSQFTRSIAERLTHSVLSVATEMAELDYVTAARIGADSWWDVRSAQIIKDQELFRVEKTRVSELMAKSTNFLDTFWRLTRKRNIPDRWLLRNDDLDRLNVALREPDAEVRLRLLNRMEPFMECYPPYLYHVARTQQSLGKLVEAHDTFSRLAEIGTGHFRRDEMLASSWVNMAAIREALKRDDAVEAAQQALRHATDSWPINLTAAGVLLRGGEIAEAEDAVLRNLDAELEESQSKVALVSVLSEEGDPEKIAAALQDQSVVSRLPAPVLVKCAAAMRGQKLSPVAAHRLRSSVYGFFDLNRGRDDFVLVADHSWNLQNAMFAVQDEQGTSPYARPLLKQSDEYTAVEFRKDSDAELRMPKRLLITIKFPSGRQVKVTLREQEPVNENRTLAGWVGRTIGNRELRRPAPRTAPFWLAAIHADSSMIAFGPVEDEGEADPPKISAVEEEAELAKRE